MSHLVIVTGEDGGCGANVRRVLALRVAEEEETSAGCWLCEDSEVCCLQTTAGGVSLGGQSAEVEVNVSIHGDDRKCQCSRVTARLGVRRVTADCCPVLRSLARPATCPSYPNFRARARVAARVGNELSRRSKL